MVIYMYTVPGWGQTWRLCFFQNHTFSVHLPISIKLFPSNGILTIFPIQMHGRPMLTLPLNRSKSSQGHDLYKLCIAPPPGADAKFQNHRPSGSGEDFLKGFCYL